MSNVIHKNSIPLKGISVLDPGKRVPSLNFDIHKFISDEDIEKVSAVTGRNFKDEWSFFLTEKQLDDLSTSVEILQKKLLHKKSELLIDIALELCLSEQVRVNSKLDFYSEKKYLREEICSQKNEAKFVCTSVNPPFWLVTGDACRIELVLESAEYQPMFSKPSSLFNFALREIVRNIVRRCVMAEGPTMQDTHAAYSAESLYLFFPPSFIVKRLRSGTPLPSDLLMSHARLHKNAFSEQFYAIDSEEIMKGMTTKEDRVLAISAAYQKQKEFMNNSSDIEVIEKSLSEIEEFVNSMSVTD